MTEKKTEALKIMNARHTSYARYPSGYMDETDLLLMQQHFSELKARSELKSNKAKKQKAKIK